MDSLIASIRLWQQPMTIKESADKPKTGIVIFSEPSADSSQLTVHLQFRDEGSDELNTAWIRSLSICCISAGNQAVTCRNFLRGRAVLSGDLKRVYYKVPLVAARLNLDLSKDLGRELVKDQYFITVSARQYLSNTVVIEVE